MSKEKEECEKKDNAYHTCNKFCKGVNNENI